MSPEYYACQPFHVISNELWSIVMILYVMKNGKHHHNESQSKVLLLWNIPDPNLDVMFKHLIVGNGITSTDTETNQRFAQYIDSIIQGSGGNYDLNDDRFCIQKIITHDIEDSLIRIRPHPNLMMLLQNVFKLQVDDRITFQSVMEWMMTIATTAADGWGDFLPDND